MRKHYRRGLIDGSRLVKMRQLRAEPPELGPGRGLRLRWATVKCALQRVIAVGLELL